MSQPASAEAIAPQFLELIEKNSLDTDSVISAIQSLAKKTAKDAFAEAVAAARRKGLTPEEMAELIGISQPSRAPRGEGARTRSTGGGKSSEATRQDILKLLQDSQAMTAQSGKGAVEIATKLNVPRPAASLALKALMAANLVKKEGNSRAAVYFIAG